MNKHKAQKTTLFKINSKPCAFCIIQTVELCEHSYLSTSDYQCLKLPVENMPNIKNNPKNQATHVLDILQLNGGNVIASRSSFMLF